MYFNKKGILSIIFLLAPIFLALVFQIKLTSKSWAQTIIPDASKTAFCTSNCETIKTEVCNLIGKSTLADSSYKLWYAASAEAAFEELVIEGSIPTLDKKQCTEISYNPNKNGVYKFQIFLNYSNQSKLNFTQPCSVSGCIFSTPTPTPIDIGLIQPDPLDIEVEQGSTEFAFTLASTWATGFTLYGYPTTYGSGINLTPVSGGMLAGSTLPVSLEVISTVPVGIYSGFQVLKNPALTGVELTFPVTVRVLPKATPTPTPLPTVTPTPNIWIDITQPNGGETLYSGDVYQIKWDNSSNVDMVTLGYKSCDSCLDWISGAYNIANTGSFAWTVNVGNTTNTQFKIYAIGYDVGVGSFSDTSDNWFTVLPKVTPTPSPTPITNETTFYMSSSSGSTIMVYTKDESGKVLGGVQVNDRTPSGSVYTQITDQTYGEAGWIGVQSGEHTVWLTTDRKLVNKTIGGDSWATTITYYLGEIVVPTPSPSSSPTPAPVSNETTVYLDKGDELAIYTKDQNGIALGNISVLVTQPSGDTLNNATDPKYGELIWYGLGQSGYYKIWLDTQLPIKQKNVLPDIYNTTVTYWLYSL